MGTMRTIPLGLALLTLLWAAPAAADQTDPRLERLFHQLAAVRTAPEASDLEVQITTIWTKSGSDTVDVLMSRAGLAVDVQDFAAAKKLLDSVVEMKPDYAQVWFRRAELLLLMDSQQEAASDLQRAIELEPRHFNALAAAGRLAEAAGDKAAALAAYRRAVVLNPMMEAVARRAGQLTFEVEKKPPT
jgi:tetratricopeptide (TPR) repeat protein